MGMASSDKLAYYNAVPVIELCTTVLSTLVVTNILFYYIAMLITVLMTTVISNLQSTVIYDCN
jgi:hypothetical protein